MMLPPGVPFTVAVNISGEQLQSPEITNDLLGRSSALVYRHNSDAGDTESTVARDGEAALTRLRSLKSLGVPVRDRRFRDGLLLRLSSLERFPVTSLKSTKRS